MTLLRRLLGWLAPYSGRLALALLCMAAFAGLNVATAWLIKPFLDQGLFARPATDPERWAAFLKLAEIAGLLVGATILKAFAKYGSDYLTGSVGQLVIFDLRLALFTRLSRLSLKFYHARKTGDLLSRVINDVAAMQVMLTQIVGPASLSAVSIVGLSAWLVHLNWKLAAVALLVFPVAVWPIRKFGRALRRYSRQVQELASDLAAHLQETLGQMKLVQAYEGEDREIHRWRHKLLEQLSVTLRVLRVQARSSPIMETIGVIGFFFLILVAGWQIHMKGAMTGGELGSFIGTVLLLYPQVKALNGLWNNLQSGLSATERVFPILDEVPEVRDTPAAVVLPTFSTAIRYDHVTFAYREGEPVLHDLSLDIPHGSRLAFVGPSGAGKTTVIDLLMRFYDPDAGSLIIDGHDLRGVMVASLRSQVALVTQEVLLFNASARDNLLYARPGASHDAVEDAAAAAGAHDFLKALPEGYDTVIGDRGVKLSGGERQRLSIARAFLKDAPILILDEATASLDAASEALIQSALDQLMANRTVLLIAHRLATVRRADRIVVLEAGRIVASGTHDALYAQGGLYRKLCDLQFQEASTPQA
ncbi:MAG: ABC transporter ATP-binding protein [Candidatus Coatesbacteria bacterium]